MLKSSERAGSSEAIEGTTGRVAVTKELTGLARRSRAASSPRWDQAVQAAADKLNAGWILPETECHPDIAEELAAFLCAFGEPRAGSVGK